MKSKKKPEKKLYVVVDQDDSPLSYCHDRAEAERELEAWRDWREGIYYIEVYNFTVAVPE